MSNLIELSAGELSDGLLSGGLLSGGLLSGQVAAGEMFAASESSTLLRTEIAIVILLAIAAGVAVIAKRLQFPFTVALVIAGFAATLLGDLVAVEVSADLILALLVPPLLFEATLHLPWKKLKADLTPILVAALVGTALGTLVVGAVIHQVLGIEWAAAFAFGALISATDPVAVIAFFKSLGAPKRLAVLVEGESLFNDAVAVVAFGLAIGVAEGEEFSVGGALSDFFVVSAGGLAVGLVLGYVVGEMVLSRLDDPLIETSATLALAYGSFLLAEEFGLVIGREDLHFSGILAVVAAGLMVGTVGLKNTSPSTRLALEHAWELFTWLVNAAVFLLLGLTVSLSALADHIGEVLLAVGVVLGVRLVIVYGIGAITDLAQPGRKVPFSYKHVMFWGGLRGAISLALALTISEELFDPETVETLLVMTFGVVLFTLLIQGISMAPLIRALGLAGLGSSELEQQEHQARIYMARAGQAEMARLGADGVLFTDMADAIGRAYQRDINAESVELSSHFRAHPELEVAMLMQARREALTVELGALSDSVRIGLVDPEVADELTIETNDRLAALDLLAERWESDFLPEFEGGRE
ncbi:MAG: CPA1 family monovalent cation:H+ antiporter [Acidimicrobiales bacterium]